MLAAGYTNRPARDTYGITRQPFCHILLLERQPPPGWWPGGCYVSELHYFIICHEYFDLIHKITTSTHIQ